MSVVGFVPTRKQETTKVVSFFIFQIKFYLFVKNNIVPAELIQ